MVLNTDGSSVLSRHDYQPFGEELYSGVGLRSTTQGYNAGDGVKAKYAGMEADEGGMNHTLWRQYESKSGRWTAPDPYSGSMSVSDPQSFNRYSYVNNDPINHVDLLGLQLSDIGIYQTDNPRVARGLDYQCILNLRYFNNLSQPAGSLQSSGKGNQFVGAETRKISSHNGNSVWSGSIFQPPANEFAGSMAESEGEEAHAPAGAQRKDGPPPSQKEIDRVTAIAVNKVGLARRNLIQFNRVIASNQSRQSAELILCQAVSEGGANDNGFVTDSVGGSGELGLFQLMLPTAKDYDPNVTADELLNNVGINTRIGTQHLQRQIDSSNGDVAKGLQRYNQGQGSINKHGLSTAAQLYASKILACERVLKSR